MRAKFCCLIGIASAVGLAVLSVRQTQRVYDPVCRTTISNCFKQLALGMHNYADQHGGTFPPPAIYSADGKPLLSWCVIILPYIEEQNLYELFKLDEPWDSPNNRALLPKMSALFDGGADHKPGATHTTYRVFVGPGAAFESRHGIRWRDFPDGTSNTLLIVEANEPVPWTKPAELAYAPEGALPALGRKHPDKFCVALADGSVEFVPKTVSETALRAAITRNGGEPFEPLAPERGR